MSQNVKMLGRVVVAFAVTSLVVPVLAHGADFSFVTAQKITGKVTLTATVNGTLVKGNSVAVAPGTPVNLNWTIPAGFKGCWSNWSNEPITATGNITGTIPARDSQGREIKGGSFVITCSAAGASQSASVSVSVAKPNLTVTLPTISGTIVNKKYALSVPFTLTYSVKNVSKVAVNDSFGFSVQLYKRQGDGTPVAVTGASQELQSLAAGASRTFTFNDTSRAESVALNDYYSYRVCTDGDGTGKGDIDESNENDNCSAFTKGFAFGN